MTAAERRLAAERERARARAADGIALREECVPGRVERMAFKPAPLMLSGGERKRRSRALAKAEGRPAT